MAREKCKNPGCGRVFNIRHPSEVKDWRYTFCPQCKRKFGKVQFGYKVLVAQADYRKPIEQTLKTLLRQHRNAATMADLLNISKPTLYVWIRKFFGVNTFLEFKRQYLCAKKSCVPVSKEDIGADKLQAIMSKLKARRLCYCSIWGRGVLLIYAPITEVDDILKKCSRPD